jgi:DNA-binding NarL/FixJ family response regulator
MYFYYPKVARLFMGKVLTAVVVDDNELTIRVLCDYLEMINVAVLGSGHDGKDAVELYKKHKPDILFLDLLMPKHDGFFALEQIRKRTPDAVIVVVTSDLSKETAERLDVLNPTRVIYKPFAVGTISEIVEKIRKSKQHD